MTVMFLILFTIVAVAVVALYCFGSLKENYRKYNLLRIDPLETGFRDTNDEMQSLTNADIWMLGDSRIARWDSYLVNTEMSVANLGMEGQSSAQVYYRFKNYLEEYTPMIVILEVGINDLKVIGLDKDLAASVTANFFHNIEGIIRLCGQKNIHLIMLNIFPAGEIELTRRLIWNKAVNETIKSVNETLESYCDAEWVFCLDAYSLLSDNGETVKPEYRDDFLHINKRGYNILSIVLNEQINIIRNK